MKLQDILPLMTKMYLNRIVGSFIKDVRISDEEEMRDVILRNQSEFYNKERVKANLNFLEDERNIDVINEIICICLIQRPNYLATYDQLLSAVLAFEETVLRDSDDARYIKDAIPAAAQNIYLPVLEAAWDKDGSLNAHEKNMLNVLRAQLHLSRRHHRLIESKIGRFPQDGNKLHSHRQIDESIRDLQSKGIILRFKTDEEYFVIPNEISEIVRYQLGGEIKVDGYRLLLKQLRVDQLRRVLSDLGLSTSGAKTELIDAVVRFDILPSSALAVLNTAELTDIVRSLEGARISGSKDEKIRTIIDYFEEIVTPTSSDATDQRAKYYDVYNELASRDYKTLRVNQIITKDIEIERHFETATDYLFEEKLGLEIKRMDGSKHADGRLQYSAKDVFLWDNKSTEAPYSFPEDHYEQFLRYIESEVMRPTAFLVIVGEVSEQSRLQAHKLKAQSRTDTDVAIIQAKDLKYVAENWWSYSGKKTPKFDLQVFNMTGILDRETLEDRMSWALQ